MPFIPAEDTAQVQVWSTLHEQNLCNTFHILKVGGWTEAALVAAGAGVIADWNDQVGPLLSGAAQFRVVKLRDMSEEEGLSIEAAFPALSGGDRIGPPMPGNVAICCKMITNFAGRNRRGRLFLSGLEEDQQDGNHLTEIARGQIETNMRNFIIAQNGRGYVVVVASYYDGTILVEYPNGEIIRRPAPRPTALMTPVTTVTVDAELDSMRSRLTGRGN